MSTFDEVIALFEDDMWNSYTVPLQSKYHYNAHIFRQMIEEYGGLGAAEKLLASEDIPYGLAKLWEIGMLHLSAEALVLKPEYRSPFELFTPHQREIARHRLKDHFQYEVP